MLNLIGKAFITVIFSWVLAVIVDRVMTRVTLLVVNLFRSRKTATAK